LGLHGWPSIPLSTPLPIPCLGPTTFLFGYVCLFLGEIAYSPRLIDPHESWRGVGCPPPVWDPAHPTNPTVGWHPVLPRIPSTWAYSVPLLRHGLGRVGSLGSPTPWGIGLLKLLISTLSLETSYSYPGPGVDWESSYLYSFPAFSRGWGGTPVAAVPRWAQGSSAMTLGYIVGHAMAGIGPR
jgi:hypothetical protein